MLKVSSIIVGLLAMSLITFVIKKRGIADSKVQKNENGYFVIRVKTLNVIMMYFCLFASILFFVGCIVAEKLTRDTIMAMLLLGTMLFLLSIFFMLQLVYDRIEYDETEICQYRVFRKNHISIRWEDVARVTSNKMVPLIEIESSTSKIFIDLKINGIVHLMKFEKFIMSTENKDKLQK